MSRPGSNAKLNRQKKALENFRIMPMHEWAEKYGYDPSVLGSILGYSMYLKAKTEEEQSLLVATSGY